MNIVQLSNRVRPPPPRRSWKNLSSKDGVSMQIMIITEVGRRILSGFHLKHSQTWPGCCDTLQIGWKAIMCDIKLHITLHCNILCWFVYYTLHVCICLKYKKKTLYRIDNQDHEEGENVMSSKCVVRFTNTSVKYNHNHIYLMKIIYVYCLTYRQ